MKILQLNSVYKYGSTGRIVESIHNILQKNNFESYIGYGRGFHNEEHTICIGNSFDMYSHALGSRLFDKHGLYSEKVTYEFLKKLDKLKPDIIHLHNIHGYYINYVILFQYLKKHNIKTIWTLHDCWSYTGHCSYYDYVDCQRWQDICRECPQKNKYPSSLLFDNSTNNFLQKKESFLDLKNLTIVTPSLWLKNEIKKSFLGEYKTICINNGIDLNMFQPYQSSFRIKKDLENKFLILGVASIWEERKGFDYFLKLSKLIEVDEQIILVGLNKKQLKNLPENILGIERTDSQKELAEIYSSVDVFVNPTLEDNFPTTNLESLACGTPVVTFNSGGSPETIDEKSGIIVEKGNLKALHKAIQQIKFKRVYFSSKECRSRAEKYFNKNDKFQEYIELYEKSRKI